MALWDNLLAYYKLDSDANTSIGAANLTPSAGTVSYVAGKIGNAAALPDKSLQSATSVFGTDSS